MRSRLKCTKPWLSAHYGSLSVSCSENGSEAKLALYAQEDCVGKPDTQVMATKQCIQVLVIASVVTCIKSSAYQATLITPQILSHYNETVVPLSASDLGLRKNIHFARN
jgi:hypothetical protein